MTHRTRFAALAMLGVGLLHTPAATLGAQEFKIVAHAATDVGDLSAATAARIFLKQDKKFPSGAAATPVDQAKTVAVRGSFTREIHSRSVSAVETYWQQQPFSGRDTPPESKAGDNDVLAFVKSTPGAIGYVSAGATVPAGVKVITLK